MKVLKTSNFSPPNWFPLGLSLSLPKPTLVAIEAEHSNNLSQCLEECLSQWLRKGVVEKDGPTWESLVGALRGIGEVSSAEMIEISRQFYNVKSGI